MKLFYDWDAKYVGISRNGMAYYILITHPDVRFWGYEEDYYDAPLYRFGLWFVSFHWHYEGIL